MRRAKRLVMSAVLTAAGLAVLVGCSTYGGEKLGLKADGTPAVATAIPYSLVRPEFTLTRMPPAEGQKTPTYTLAVSYEPDPKQFYTLRLDPAIFADPYFLMKLGAGGTLVGTTAGFTEQITPTIAAIGSFTATLVGALAKGVFDEDSLRAQIKNALTTAAQQRRDSACNKTSVVPRYGARKSAQKITVADELKSRLDGFRDDTAFAELFHYLNQDELGCLKEALELLRQQFEAIHEKAITAYQEGRKEYLAQFVHDTLFVEQLDAAIATDRSTVFDAIKKAIDDAKTDDATKEKAAAREPLFGRARRAAKATAAVNAVQPLEAVVTLGPITWRARHLLYLERAIEAAALDTLQEPNRASEFEKDLKSLREQRAAAIGAPELYARAQMLADFLTRIRERAVDRGGRAPATAEFAMARAELDETLKQIDARRSRVLTDAKPPQPQAAPPLPPTRVELVKPDFIKSAEGKEKPNYVVIIEEIK